MVNEIKVKENGNILDSASTAKKWMITFQPRVIIYHNTSADYIFAYTKSKLHSIFLPRITEEDVSSAIAKLESSTACGFDKIMSSILFKKGNVLSSGRSDK